MRKAHRTMRRRPLFTPVWLAALGSVLAVVVGLWLWEMAGTSTATVILVRHADKLEAPSVDPALSPAGEQRARALGEALRDGPLAAIYVTEYRRTRQTAAPVAEVTGAEVIEIPADDSSELLQRLRAHRGEIVLVVGHRNSVPGVVSELGGETALFAEDEFERLLVVTWGPFTRTRVLALRYGD